MDMEKGRGKRQNLNKIQDKGVSQKPGDVYSHELCVYTLHIYINIY